MDKEFVAKCEKYMEEHCLSGKITLNVFAKELGYNPSYLSRTYKKETGRNIMGVFRDKKMEAAEQLLMAGNNNTYVATLLEFSKNGFTKAYKKTTGINPSCVYKKTKGEK